MDNRQIPLSQDFTNPVPLGLIEEQTYSRGFKCVAGLDEVGRGPLAGPVVAAAVVLPRGFSHPDIKDSKLLTASQRERLVPVIEQTAVAWGLGVVDVEEIDRINILRASLLAMGKALPSTAEPGPAPNAAPTPMPTPSSAHDTRAKRRVAMSQRSPPSPRMSDAIANRIFLFESLGNKEIHSIAWTLIFVSSNLKFIC